jgi:hypothetical protein
MFAFEVVQQHNNYNTLLMCIVSLFLYKLNTLIGGSWKLFMLCTNKALTIFYLYICEAKHRIITYDSVQ